MSAGKKVLEVRCPQCGGASLWAPENVSRPFCSPRCKLIDLGAWANEEYRVAVVEDDQDAEAQTADSTGSGALNS